MSGHHTSRVVVVVDSENIRLRAVRLSGLCDVGPPDVDLMSRVLGRSGLDVVHVVYASATERNGSEHNGTRAARNNDLVRDLAVRTDVTVLRGVEGDREVGVDSLLVMGALHACRSIRSGRIGADGIVVLSSDSDIRIIHRYPTNVPVLYLGEHAREVERAVLDEGATAAELPDDAVLEMCGVGTPTGQIQLPSATWTGQPGSRDGRSRWKHVRDAGAVAVVDAYGLLKSTRQAYGRAQLPSAAAIGSILRSMGFRAPYALYATVPDIPDRYWRSQSSRSPSWAKRVGWRARDMQLEDLARALIEDDDDATQVNVSQLKLEGPAWVPREKQTETYLAADVYWALARTASTTPVVLFSDLDGLDVVHPALWELDLDPSRFFQVTVHPLSSVDPLVMRPEMQKLEAHRQRRQNILLTETLARPLMPIGHSPLSSRQRLADMVMAGHVGTWEVCDYEPELDCVRLTPLDVRWAGATLLLSGHSWELGQRVDVSGVTLQSSQKECAAPAVHALVGSDPRSHFVTATVVGDVVDGYAEFDVDGDGLPDGRVAVGHERTMTQAGAVLQLQAVGEVRYIGPRSGVTSVAGGVQLVQVEHLDDDGAGLATTASGSVVVLRPRPGLPSVLGATQMAEPIGPDQSSLWEVISTPLSMAESCDPAGSGAGRR